MKPLKDMIHAFPLEIRQSKGIHLSEEAARRMRFGVRVWRVLDTGPGRVTRSGRRIPVEARPGDRVITNFEQGGEIQLQDGSVMFSEQHVLGVMPPD